MELTNYCIYILCKLSGLGDTGTFINCCWIIVNVLLVKSVTTRLLPLVTVKMDSDEEALLLTLSLRRRRRRKLRQYWVHPIIENRDESQFYLLYNSLRMYDDKFFNYFRMSKNTFDYLLSELIESVQRSDSTMRKSIKADERLALTIR